MEGMHICMIGAVEGVVAWVNGGASVAGHRTVVRGRWSTWSCDLLPGETMKSHRDTERWTDGLLLVGFYTHSLVMEDGRGPLQLPEFNHMICCKNTFPQTKNAAKR